jgi:small subunit ribosomal protein S6
MLNNYETVFILTPVLSEDQAKEAVNKYKDLITQAGGKLVHEEHWGLKKLAYPIQKKTSGFYHLIQFQAKGNFVSDLEINYKRDERIIRFMTVVLDKYALAYSERRRNKKDENKEKANA